MKAAALCLLVGVVAGKATAAEYPVGVDQNDRLLRLGCLDVTKAPYRADRTGAVDSTEAIQRAVNDARDHRLVCFFPPGTYLISDTLSCEQQVRKLDRPRFTDGQTQHYWDLPHRIVMVGSTKGKRPVLRLSKDAKGFDDPAKPKIVVWNWAQTRHDAPGKEEPEWGQEQPNISFNHIFRGIDIDVRGHAGAIGIRHAGSQGSTMQDVTVDAQGAYAGLNCCPGQGGGTHHVEVIGGQYGIVVEPTSRFPLLNSCVFRGQTKASIGYAKGGSQVPTLLVGCRLEPAGPVAIDMTTESNYAGISMVDCRIALGDRGVVVRTNRPQNVFLENTFVRGAESILSGGAKVPTSDHWTHVKRYSSHNRQGTNLLNGVLSTGDIAQWYAAATEPDPTTIGSKHYTPGPSFEDPDAVNVCQYGARGDGVTDDTAAFAKAIAEHDKVFVPKGDYGLSGTLRLRPDTQLFGLSPAFTSLGSVSRRDAGRPRRSPPAENSFTVETVDDAAAAPGLSFLTLRGLVQWRSGRGTWMLTRAPFRISGNGGGRFYGVMAMGRPWVLSRVRHPTAFYALNVERVTVNPQSEIRDCEDIRIYYFKVEAGTIQRPNAGDGNTPCRISNSRDVRIHCMYGNVRQLGDRPMLDVENSDEIVVSQLKAFRAAGFPHLVETTAETRSEIPSSKTCALFVRDSTGGTLSE